MNRKSKLGRKKGPNPYFIDLISKLSEQTGVQIHRPSNLDPDPDYKSYCCMFQRSIVYSDPLFTVKSDSGFETDGNLIWIRMLNMVSIEEYKCYCYVFLSSKSWL